METYSDIIFMLSFAGLFISIISFVVCALCKKTREYAWIFGCAAGFCFFTGFRHICFQIGYGDITDPSYEAYKDWTIYHFILSDTIRLLIWVGIGILNYMVFVKRNKFLRRLFLLGAGLFLLFMALLAVLSSTTSIETMGGEYIAERGEI